jgi:hypothetical protein
MRITIKPPSPTPAALQAGALLTVRVEAADPSPLLSGPPIIAYEGRYAPANNPPAFLFPANGHEKEGVSTATSAASDFRLPPSTPLQPHVDIPAHEGDRVTATLLAGGKAYTAALTAPAAPLHPDTAPVVLQLAEGGAAPPAPPTPQPAPGLTITPDDPDDPDVLTLDPAPGNDNIVVVN